MKRYIIVLICGAMTILFSSCEKEVEEYVAVTSISISQSTAEILIGETVQLTANVLPSNATDKTIFWASSKQSVATVSDSGLVSALKEGISTITVSAGGQQATCVVNVGKPRVTTINLSKTLINLATGEQETITAVALPQDSEDLSITWTSSDENVAIVNDGVVSARGEGNAYIIASNGSVQARCFVIVFEASVDLGLSVRWASRNIGAKIPEEYGDYFAWGEIEPKKDFKWDNYKWISNRSLTKYGEVDNKTQLDTEDDAANQLLGRDWRMPTYDELKELYENCEFKWENRHGYYGAVVVSKINNKSIFLPAPLQPSEYGDTPIGHYWSSTLSDSWSARVLISGLALISKQYFKNLASNSRELGNLIRPVCPKTSGDEELSIKIDGDLSDWDAIEGTSNGTFGSFKAASDDKNLYFYCYRTTEQRYSDIWGGYGYIYVGFELDNNPANNTAKLWASEAYDLLLLIYPYGGSASAPAITEAAGTAGACEPAPCTVANVVCKGVVDQSGAKIEFSVPRTDISTIPSSEITVTAWGNKDLAKVELKCSL